jgi:hypothetical protein
MGFDGTYLYDGENWAPHARDRQPDAAEPWLLVDIRDNVTTITYRPSGGGSGVAHLRTGDTQRADVSAEAAGLTDWWALRHPDDPAYAEKKAQIADYLSGPGANAPADETDYSEVYVELKTSRFLVALDLPVPDVLLH